MAMAKLLTPEYDHAFEATIGDAMAEFGPSAADVRAFEEGFSAWLINVEAISGRTLNCEVNDDALTAYEDGVTAADYAMQLQAGV
jgi:hypothetical protein